MTAIATARILTKLHLMARHYAAFSTRKNKTKRRILRCCECFEHVMHEDDNIVMIFKVVGNDITNNLVSMLTFSRDCSNSGN